MKRGWVLPLSTSMILIASATNLSGQSDGSRLAAVRKARLSAAQECYERSNLEFVPGRLSGYVVYLWSRNWMNASLTPRTDSPENVVAREAHVERCSKIDAVVKSRVASGKAGRDSYLTGDYFL